MPLLTRREMLLAAGAGVATLALPPSTALAVYTLPPLPYATNALKPYIDAETMKIHHGRHHLAYVTAANNLLKDHPKLLAMPVDKLLADIDRVPKEIRQGVINNAGGHSNHSIFWEIMGPEGGKLDGRSAVARAIDKAFGSFDKFQKEMSTKAQTQFGSGWAWLVVNKKGGLEVVQRGNQNSPIMDGLKPILGIDVWEHAYYLQYKNQRPEYIKRWWNVVNWGAVSERYKNAMKG